MKLKRRLLNIFAVFAVILVPTVSISTAAAAGNPPPPCGQTAAAQQVLGGINKAGNNCGDTQVNSLFQDVVVILSIIVGLASVIVLLIGGFKYIASGGESNKVANAKNTVLYAVVGLAVASLTQLLIHFVLFQTNK